MPCSIARTDVQVIVTVLPERVAPSTSVCVPPVGPPSGIETRRPLSSSPTISRSARTSRFPPAGIAIRGGHRAGSRMLSQQLRQGPADERCAPRPAGPGARRLSRPGRRPRRGLPGASAARARSRTAPPCRAWRRRRRRCSGRASTTTANATGAQVQRRCRLRIARAAISPITSPIARCRVVLSSQCMSCSIGASGFTCGSFVVVYSDDDGICRSFLHGPARRAGRGGWTTGEDPGAAAAIAA